MASLLICSNEKEFEFLVGKSQEKYYIGTKNYTYYQQCREVGQPVLYLESEEEMPCQETWKILSSINETIKSCKLEKEYLYTFSHHIEGGFELQLAELLLTIKFLKNIIEENRIDRICMVDNKEHWKLNEAAFLLAESCDIEHFIFNEQDGREEDCLYTMKNSLFDKKRKRSNRLHQALWKKYFNYLKLPKKKVKRKINKYEIGCLYPVKNYSKHLMWLLNEVKMYSDKFSLNIISFYYSDDVKQMQNEGITVDCLEDYFNKYTFLRDFWSYIHSIDAIKRKLEKELDICYCGVDLKIYLCKKIMNFLQREHFEYLYIDHCMKNYFKMHTYKLIRAWGDSNFWQTYIAYQNTRKQKTKFYGITKNEAYDVFLYEPNAEQIPIRFFPNRKIAEQILKYSCFKKQIYIVPDLDMYNRFYNNLNKKQEENERKHSRILFATQLPFVGVATLKDCFEACKSILDILPREGCEVFVKNHPNMLPEIENIFFEGYRNHPNIKFVDKKSGIMEAMELCDIVIVSSNSMTLFDAAIAQKPTFCLRYNKRNENTLHHKEGFCIYDDATLLCKDVLGLINGGAATKITKQNMLNQQNKYMQKIIGEKSNKMEEMICDIFQKELKEMP